jgi:serine/threonine-protein kinase
MRPAKDDRGMIGSIFMGQYEVKRFLAEGGMARVYLARQYHPPRQVVIKVMHEHIIEDPKSRQRFERETEMLHRFQHPGIANILDASLDDPLGPCIVMEYVRGIGLDKLLEKNGRFTQARVGRFLNQICDTLQTAHERGIMHRDLKPSNLMIVDADTPNETVKTLDFGLAKLISPEPDMPSVTLTNAEFGVGTPNYVSPEQANGGATDHRSDLYSLGVVAYELLSGQVPFVRTTDMDVLLAHATECPPNFEELGLGSWVSRAVEDVVFSCLEKDPGLRPQSALELSERFDAALVTPDEQLETETIEYVPPPVDPNTLKYEFEAWMPQRVAIIKLRGNVQDNHGEIIASEPGRILVQMGHRTGRISGAALSWLGLAKPQAVIASGLTELELRLEHIDPNQENLLHVSAHFRAADESEVRDPGWRGKCNQLFCELRSYMMGYSA